MGKIFYESFLSIKGVLNGRVPISRFFNEKNWGLNWKGFIRKIFERAFFRLLIGRGVLIRKMTVYI